MTEVGEVADHWINYGESLRIVRARPIDSSVAGSVRPVLFLAFLPIPLESPNPEAALTQFQLQFSIPSRRERGGGRNVLLARRIVALHRSQNVLAMRVFCKGS